MEGVGLHSQSSQKSGVEPHHCWTTDLDSNVEANFFFFSFLKKKFWFSFYTVKKPLAELLASGRVIFFQHPIREKKCFEENCRL